MFRLDISDSSTVTFCSAFVTWQCFLLSGYGHAPPLRRFCGFLPSFMFAMPLVARYRTSDDAVRAVRQRKAAALQKADGRNFFITSFRQSSRRHPEEAPLQGRGSHVRSSEESCSCSRASPSRVGVSFFTNVSRTCIVDDRLRFKEGGVDHSRGTRTRGRCAGRSRTSCADGDAGMTR
jgi:hypothetical protein